MIVNSPSEKFVVPYEVFELLDPIEKIIILKQADRGEVLIIKSDTAGGP